MVVDFKNRKLNLIACIMLLSFTSIFAQSDIEKGDKAFTNLKYQDAIVHYQNASKNNKDKGLLMKLAEAYYLTGRYFDAEALLKPLSEENTAAGTLLLKYANILLINGKIDDAKSVLKKYIISNPSNEEYKKLFESANFELKPIAENIKFSVEPAKFSSEVSDFSPMFYGEKIVYTSTNGGKKDSWTGKSFANIFITDDSKTKATQLEGNLNGKFHNGAVTFVDDQMIFTRNNSKKGKNNDYNLILAIAKKSGNKWNFDSEFISNDLNYSNAYPTYSPKLKILIFSSDRPGGLGGMDLYYSLRIGDSWGAPVNMGKSINTNNDEVFPYIVDNDLYFSSNGYPGQGGLDIFKAKISNNVVSNIENVGSPINGNRDDFGLITKDGLQTGYFSSNRQGSGDIDRIFYFSKETINLPPKSIIISGKVIDEYTKIPLKEAEVTLTNTSDGTKQTFMTLEDGRFSFNAVSDANYTLSGIKNKINTTKETIVNTNINDTYYYTLLHNDPRFSLEGFAVNNKTQKGVAGVKVICFNKTARVEETAITDEKGFFKFQLNQNSDFEISGTKDNYYTSVSEATTKGLNRSTTLYVKLYLSIEEIIIGETKILGKESFGGFEFEPVYYDLDKSFIRPDAGLALDKVVTFMEKNPNLKIELGSHTDSRSSGDYNQGLSQRRAQAAVEYIIKNGISSDRIVSKGYGETALINHCADGVKCSEDLHQLNRRTEIKIIGK
jgi:outer membrane protein OmpA-like peptidoglycan-associated protein/tetratricopeptide (TPR) repeat protein